jgi:hypothetical protein
METIRNYQTNEEFVSDLMNFSPVGALCQVFIIEALNYYSNQIVDIPDDAPEWERSLVSLPAWKTQAAHIIKKLEERNK